MRQWLECFFKKGTNSVETQFTFVTYVRKNVPATNPTLPQQLASHHSCTLHSFAIIHTPFSLWLGSKRETIDRKKCKKSKRKVNQLLCICSVQNNLSNALLTQQDSDNWVKATSLRNQIYIHFQQHQTLKPPLYSPSC